MGKTVPTTDISRDKTFVGPNVQTDMLRAWVDDGYDSANGRHFSGQAFEGPNVQSDMLRAWVDDE
jgi:hypothetical protein